VPIRRALLFLSLSALLLSSLACGQSAPAASPAPATAPPQDSVPSPTWSAGPIDFSGLIDGYYSFNFNHPASGFNQLYNFNVRSNEFSLNMAKLSLSHAAGPVGFQVDFGFGRSFDIISAGEKAPQIFRYLEQAYISLKPPTGKGFQVDFGKFVTSDGAEVIESSANWNYSRSLLFSWAIPYYHFGVRATFPVGKHFTAGVMLVNGWNNVEDNNSGKTLMFTGTYTAKKFAWTNNFHTGPEKPGANKGFRNLYDTTLLLTPTAKWNAYLNFDYGSDRNIGPGSQVWYGAAVAAHYQATPKISFTPRVEWFNDRDGFATATGVQQQIKEATFTGEYKFPEGLLARLEYRHDWSNQPFFQRGSSLGCDCAPAYMGPVGTAKSQDTLTLGIVAFFGPKR
jgi:hypothetical protein